MKKCLFAVLIFLPALLLAAPGSLLRVKVTGVSSDKGIVRVVLFNSKEGFPGKARKAFRVSDTPISGMESTAEFKDIPPGVYAATAMHDTVGDRKIRRNFLGLPTSGVGASNNPSALRGTPSFNNCKFEVNTSTVSITVRLKYF